MRHSQDPLIANEPAGGSAQEYRDKIHQMRADHDLQDPGDVIFVEVTVTDPSDFETDLRVRGQVRHGQYRVLTMGSPSVPSALAAQLLHIRDRTVAALTSTSSGPRATQPRTSCGTCCSGTGDRRRHQGDPP